MMKQRRWMWIKIACLAGALLLGQLVLGAGVAGQAEDEEAEYWSFVPVVTRYLGFREASGVLDTSFGEDGIAFTDIGDEDSARDVLVQPDKKILVVGVTHIFQSSSSEDFALVRYNHDGSLDTSFGNNGIVTTDFFQSNDYSNSAFLQPDGKIVVAGNVEGYNEEYGGYIDDFALARYNPDGSLDTSFDGDGRVVTIIDHVSEAFDVVLQPDSKIIAFGVLDTVPGKFVMVRYNPDGSVDGYFDGGIVLVDFDGHDAYGLSVGLQEDGKIVGLGVCDYDADGDREFALARINKDGTPDLSFGDMGKVITHFEAYAEGYQVVIQPDGKILAGGTLYHKFGGDYDIDIIMARYDQSGSLDPSFGIDGKLVSNLSTCYSFEDLELQPDDKIVISGNNHCESPSIFLARYWSDGSLDTSFGNQGVVTPALGFEIISGGLAIQPDGKLLVAGYTMNVDIMLVMRYK